MDEILTDFSYFKESFFLTAQLAVIEKIEPAAISFIPNQANPAGIWTAILHSQFSILN
ncbi:MAG: hypothetical protein Q4C10_10580 [Clostridia bacterium]|nr:hypothetical protein [Clostridia bacterium]